MKDFIDTILGAARADRRLLIDAGLTLGANLLGVILIFGMQVLLARLLGEQSYSLYTYALAILTVLTTLGLFGFDVAILRFVPTLLERGDYGAVRGYARRAFQTAFVATLILGVGLVVAGELLVWSTLSDLNSLLLVTALAVPGGSLLLLASAYARALGRPLLAAAPRLVGRPLAIMVVVFIIANSQNSLSPAQVMVAELVVGLALLIFVALFVVSHIRPLTQGAAAIFETKLWLAVSFPLFLNSGFQIVLRHTDILILGSFVGANHVGSYAAASKIAQLAAFGLIAINAVLPPLISRHLARGEKNAARRTVAVASLATFVFSATAASVLWVFASYFLGWFGPSFVSAVPVLKVLIAGQILNALSGSVSYILAVTGNQNLLAKAVGLTMLFNIVLCLVLIPPFGPVGAAIAVATSTILSNFALLIICISKTGIDPSVWAGVRILFSK